MFIAMVPELVFHSCRVARFIFLHIDASSVWDRAECVNEKTVGSD